MKRASGTALLFAILCPALLLVGQTPTSQPAATQAMPMTTVKEPSDPPFDWKGLGEALGKPGDLKDEVYTVRYPRKDLEVRIEGFDIPAGAGLESSFYFFRCTCGKMHVVGQFCLADYETNDVIDTLREGHIEIASVAPMFTGEKPRLTLVRFQGEGKWEDIIKTLKSCFDSIGEARNPKPILK